MDNPNAAAEALLCPISTAEMPRPSTRQAIPGSSLTCLVLSAVLAMPSPAVEPQATSQDIDSAIFVDAAEATGLDFVHWNGMSGELYFPEMTGQGGALFDYDNDGDLDVYLVQGTLLGEGKTLKDALFPTSEARPRDRLYRNDLARDDAGQQVLRFTDVTKASGLQAFEYGMGVATGDVDNDGWTDLYVTNFGPNQLWRNRGNGTFENITESAQVSDPRWSTSAAFFDYDQDGDLDLYVANYVDYRLEKNAACYAKSSRRDYCGPSAFKSLPDRLLRNRGIDVDGHVSFEDVTSRVLIGYQPSAGLGITAADFNGDQRLDLYVANDGLPNQLWLQQADRTFRDEALLAGVAVNRQGMPEASMGVNAADFDGDGDEDLFLTHLSGETNTLYVNDGQGMFEDRSIESSLGAPSLSMTGFGTVWVDYDNDGLLDVVVLNGAVRILEELARKGDLYPLDQPNQVYRNVGGGRFEEVTAKAGAVFKLAEVSRGAAVGDVDNDGDGDVLILNNNGRARLLLNQVGQEKPWLGLRLVGGPSDRDQLGARVEIVRAEAPGLRRRSQSDGSYCSAGDPRVLVGLASSGQVSEIRVTWPDGRMESWQKIPLGTYTTLRQGEGKNPQ